jgi:N-acetylglucosaminyldiphosphoundecaprenol N-acetyl-beta-D-mannosaminyltransferase
MSNPEMLTKSSVLGIPVHLIDDYVAWLTARGEQKKGTHVVTLNPEISMQAQENPAFGDILHQAELVVPDGAGIVFYLWLRGLKIRRCPGIELAESMIEIAATQPDSWSVFFFGAKPGISAKAAACWQQKLPALKIAGTEHGYLTPEIEANLLANLQKLQPRLILVGLGVPKQEFWIAEHRHLCPESIWIGVGGSFDIWAGTKARAPLWTHKLHLEWAYRLYQEPWRWRRMLVLPQFAWKAIITLGH